MRATTADQFTVLCAVAAKRCTVTSAGFHLDGMIVQGNVKDILDVFWLEDFVDAELNFDEGPELLVLTSAGEAALVRARQESQH